MSPATYAVSEVARWMGLVPLLWLAARRCDGAAWYWLASAYAISWLADTAAVYTDPYLVGVLYPVSQAGLVAAVLLSRKDAFRFVLALVLVGNVAVLWRGDGPDMLLRSVAWLGVVGIVVDRWALGRLRIALLVSYGLGWACWTCYVTWPGWTSWLLYQGARLAGILLFCWASTMKTPALRLVPT